MTTTVETIESANWQIEGDPRMSDSAIHAVTLLFFDALDTEEREADGGEVGESSL